MSGTPQWQEVGEVIAKPMDELREDGAKVGCSQAFEPEADRVERIVGGEAVYPGGLARVDGTRWSMDEGCQRATGEAGLDHDEVRTWDAWYRHTTLCLLALAFLEVTRANTNAADGQGRPPTI